MCASEIGPLYDKKRNLLTSDKLDVCAILLEQFNSVFTTPLPNKQVINNNNNHLYSHKQLHVHGTYKALSTKLQLH